MISIKRKTRIPIRWNPPEVPAWWATVPDGEKALLDALARMLRSAKQSQLRDVAQAAAKWESGLGCFIKVRLMHARQGGRELIVGG